MFKLGIGLDKGSLVIGENNLSGFCARGLFYISRKAVINGHEIRVLSSAVHRRNDCRLFYCAVGRSFTLRHYNDVRACDTLCMEPHIALFGKFQRKLVILIIVSSHEDRIAVRRAVLDRRQSLRRLSLAARGLDIALLTKFKAQLDNVVLRGGSCQRIENAVDIL